MRPVRFTKAEAEALRNHLRAAFFGDCGRLDEKESKLLASVDDKLEAALAPGVAGVAAGPIEQALVRASRGKVVELAGGPAYARASKMATALEVTLQDAELVGGWLARQGWMREPTTLLGVLNKWSEWLPRARATAPPPAAQEGFDGTETAPPGPPGPSRRGGGRGSAPGFG